MKTVIINICINFLIVGIFSTQAISQNRKSNQNYPAVTLEGTEIRTLPSNIVGQDYELLVSLPKSYHSTDSDYPVIFLLDPYRTYSIVKGFTDILITPHSLIPEVIIVGIGYGGKSNEALLKWVLGRTRDLTPAKDSITEADLERRIISSGVPNVEVNTGGAELFLNFIEAELLPFIESNYRIDGSQKMLCGYSFGGLFGLYTLFNNPDLFSKYLIGSPSIHYKEGIIYDYESEYAKKYNDMNADVFISAGELEELTSNNIKKVEGLLRSRNYNSLKLKTVIFKDESHVTCIPAALGRGIYELLHQESKH
ncbi:alpha/beta hydrolase-fold protein [Mangrovivirga sp. M17]|uniref:Alpha/beta hydrolase-fold protein n=1 Tax=Mangrovivirga halotolerans TaxID=2993936 RepID=A0ABT3RQ68_9BACT|nr:alpha/beta hydrolase-fold protein [Mangrovivirga halotolerans]MCX2743776.1 alpha/beta hydrolase-fold protein [Mangrovivirga halotolerans]